MNIAHRLIRGSVACPSLCYKSEVMLLQGHDHCLNITGWLCPKNTIDWVDRGWMRNYMNVQKNTQSKNIVLQGQMPNGLQRTEF